MVMNLLTILGIEDVDNKAKFKVCNSCNQKLEIGNFQHCKRGVRGTCKKCRARNQKAINHLRKEWKKLGKEIPIECQCCGKQTTKSDLHGGSKSIVLDHDHETNKFRGWLCHDCNRGIGLLGDNISGLESAIKYLKNADAYSKNCGI